MLRWIRPVLLPALAAAFLAAACSKDNAREELASGALNPPWDSPSFVPKELDGYVYDGPDSLFHVFRVIAMIDSLGGDRKEWKLEKKPVDTVTAARLLDTAFVFPPSPMASMPYAYDDTYRDDTLYRHAYGNGLFTQDHPCATTTVLTGPFLHPARWLKAGLKETDILQALGSPPYHTHGALRYFSRRRAPASTPADSAAGRGDHEAHDVMEGANFYFLKDSLFAVVLHRSQPCR